MGVSTCANGLAIGVKQPISSAAQTTSSSASVTSSASSFSSNYSPSTNTAGLSTTDKIVIGVVIPVVVIALSIPGIFFFHKYKKLRNAAKARDALSHEDLKSQAEAGPFLQQKAELGDPERIRHELGEEDEQTDEGRRRHEMEGEDNIHEMPADEVPHELDGEDRIRKASVRRKGLGLSLKRRKSGAGEH
ncbi:hypothetical protein MMC28_008237 [Mycoblastus sanguinarius]|nr:hypothetical protein [Mycoblastus sanguinarius]